MHCGCMSDTIQWRKSARRGAAGPGASGSTKMSVYLVEGSYRSSVVIEKFGSGVVSLRIVSQVSKVLHLAINRLTKCVESIAEFDGSSVVVDVNLESRLELRSKIWNEPCRGKIPLCSSETEDIGVGTGGSFFEVGCRNCDCSSRSHESEEG